MATAKFTDTPKSERPFMVIVRGHAMAGVTERHNFPDGTELCVDPCKAPRRGSCVVVNLEGADILAQYVEDDGRVYLRYSNPHIPTLDVTDRHCKLRGTVTQRFIDQDS